MNTKTQLEQIAALLTARYPSLYILGNYDFETAQQILDICHPQWIPVTERLPDEMPLRTIEVAYHWKGVKPYKQIIGSSRVQYHLGNAYAWRESEPLPPPEDTA